MENQAADAGSPVRTLVMGCGYLGHRVGLKAKKAGHEVYATTRRPERAGKLARQGFHPIIADWTDRRMLDVFSASDLPPMDRILVAVSYDRQSCLSRYDAQVGGLQRFLKAIENHQADHGHLCYISTTGVYHQTDGQWVDETSPTHARREGGRVHLQAETLLQRNQNGPPGNILRLAGIYGPGRVPRVADVIAGRPIRSPESGYLNLIHVDDAASAVMAVWARASRSEHVSSLYVVADDQPVVRGEFYREIARQTGAAEPQFEPPAPDSPVSMRTESNKRIWNRRMKRDLVTRLKYPSYREGLADVLRG